MSYFGPFGSFTLDVVMYKVKGAGGSTITAPPDTGIPDGSIVDPTGGASIVDPSDSTTYIIEA